MCICNILIEVILHNSFNNNAITSNNKVYEIDIIGRSTSRNTFINGLLVLKATYYFTFITSPLLNIINEMVINIHGQVKIINY